MHRSRWIWISLALIALLGLPACGKKDKDKDKKGETSYEESQECKDFIAAVDKDCAAPSEANKGTCDSMKSSVGAMKKTLDFAKGKLNDEVKKSRTTMCVTQLDALKKSLQP